MSDDNKQNPKQPNGHDAPKSGGHDNDLSNAERTGVTKAAETGVHQGTHMALEAAEHQIVRVSTQVVERLAGTINSVLKTLPAQAAAAFEKVVESGKFGAGYLKYVPGIGVVAAGAGGAAEYYIATKLGEHQLDALVNAGTSTVVGVGTYVAGTAALPAALISFTACEVVREGLHVAGVGVEPSLIHQQIEASLKAYPERLKHELSIDEAKAALKDKNSEQYQAMASQYKQDYGKLAEQYKDYPPLGFPSTIDQYVDRRFSEVERGLMHVAGDAPSGIKRLGKTATKEKHAELAPMFEEAGFGGTAQAQPATQEHAKQAEAIATTAPMPAPTAATVSMNPAIEASRAEAPVKNPMLDALLGEYGFKAVSGCKLSDVGEVCSPTQQRGQQQQVAAAAAR